MPAPSYGPEPYRAPAFILALAALGRLHFSAAFALRPLRIARGRRWCEHDYPRWGAHNASDAIVKLLRAQTAAFYHGSELPRPPHGTGLRPFALHHPDAKPSSASAPAVAHNTQWVSFLHLGCPALSGLC